MSNNRVCVIFRMLTAFGDRRLLRTRTQTAGSTTYLSSQLNASNKHMVNPHTRRAQWQRHKAYPNFRQESVHFDEFGCGGKMMHLAHTKANQHKRKNELSTCVSQSNLPYTTPNNCSPTTTEA
jgi:hypothetical protein